MANEHVDQRLYMYSGGQGWEPYVYPAEGNVGSNIQYRTYTTGSSNFTLSEVQTKAYQQMLNLVHGPTESSPDLHSGLMVREYERLRKDKMKKIQVEKDLLKAGELEGEMVNNFLIGCDPEFVAMDALGRTVHLDLEEEEIGTDHGGRVGELRPKPSKGAFALTKRLQTLILSDTVKKIQASKLRAGARANEESLGGHVHFGMKMPGVKKVSEAYIADGQYVPAKVEQENPALIKALDRVTSLLEHLDILPLNESQNRRKGTYGKFGDIRDSNGHMEYRSMCSWLYDPKVAFLCLTAAKIAAADPTGTLDALTRVTSFSGLQKWLNNYRTKDSNALRVLDKIPEHKLVQVDPGVDFRERWRTLGL